MIKKVPNPQILLEFVCYVTFAVLLIYLVATGKYQSYVTPRIVPYFYFTVAVMIIWAVGGLFRLFRPQHKNRAAHCLVLAIPILLLLLPHSAINTADLSYGYLSGNAYGGLPGQVTDNTSGGRGDSTDSGSVNSASVPTDGLAGGNAAGSADDNNALANTPGNSVSASDFPGLDVENKKITVANEDFGYWLSELYVNMEKYTGYAITMTGFVYKDPALMAKDEFVPARLMMWCCAADLAPTGLLCKYGKASELKEDAWVTVEGTLFIGKTKYDNAEYDDIQVSVTKITPAKEVEGYIYP